MSRRQYVEARKLSAEELRNLPPGTIVQVSLGMGERLLLRRAKDTNGRGRFTPVHGSSLTIGALVEVAELLAPRSLSAQPAAVLAIADYKQELGLA
ncbi:hypothetical protein AB0420_11455 [Streptomyces caelestis]|uniref:Uncharacterized protein n=1 Tax=Streptomyces heliomycini TaxID=284032 RepID=A0ABV5LBX9_9ACTN